MEHEIFYIGLLFSILLVVLPIVSILAVIIPSRLRLKLEKDQEDTNEVDIRKNLIKIIIYTITMGIFLGLAITLIIFCIPVRDTYIINLIRINKTNYKNR